MTEKWNLEQLEAALGNGRPIGSEMVVGDSIDVLGPVGDIATVYFHMEKPGGDSDPAFRARENAGDARNDP